MIRLNDEVFEKLDINKNYKIICTFKNVNNLNFKIKLAPEISDISCLEDKPAIKQYMIDSSKVTFSEHKGEVEMRLCDKCERKEKQNEKTN